MKESHHTIQQACFRCSSEGKENTDTERYLSAHVDCTGIYNSETWEQPASTCLSVDEWTKKMWGSHKGILLSHTNEGNPAIRKNIDGP